MQNFSETVELTPDNPKAAAILFHGLTGSTEQVSKLAKNLLEKNYYVFAPQLSGHTGDFEIFKTTTHRSWLADARNAFKYVHQKYPELQITVIGQSFGALLALYLAGNYPGLINKCVAIACPFKFRKLSTRLVTSALSFMPDSFLNKFGSIEKSYEETILENCYPKHSIAASARLVKIKKTLLPKLSLIDCPTLIGQDPEDYHLATESSELLKKELTHASVSNLEFPKAGHRLLHGSEANNIITKIINFLEKE
ncbi:MAG: alpha/beta fold hydrolase [Bdellovibrionota bacterium]